jgi:hypothetical protein
MVTGGAAWAGAPQGEDNPVSECLHYPMHVAQASGEPAMLTAMPAVLKKDLQGSSHPFRTSPARPRPARSTRAKATPVMSYMTLRICHDAPDLPAHMAPEFCLTDPWARE